MITGIARNCWNCAYLRVHDEPWEGSLYCLQNFTQVAGHESCCDFARRFATEPSVPHFDAKELDAFKRRTHCTTKRPILKPD